MYLAAADQKRFRKELPVVCRLWPFLSATYMLLDLPVN